MNAPEEPTREQQAALDTLAERYDSVAVRVLPQGTIRALAITTGQTQTRVWITTEGECTIA